MKKVLKAKSSTIQEAITNLENPNFHGVEVIIIHVGTNDVEEWNADPQYMKEELFKLAQLAKSKFPNAAIFLSLIPPRNDPLDEIVSQTNNLIRSSSPPVGIYIIDNHNINKSMLFDRKHLHRESGVRVLINNIQRRVSEVMYRRQLPPQAGKSEQFQDRSTLVTRNYTNAMYANVVQKHTGKNALLDRLVQ